MWIVNAFTMTTADHTDLWLVSSCHNHETENLISFTDHCPQQPTQILLSINFEVKWTMKNKA